MISKIIRPTTSEIVMNIWRLKLTASSPQSLKPYVIIGFDAYSMQPTPLVKNRWETLVPVPADKDIVNYHFKVDFEYNAIPVPRSNSKLSQGYRLKIKDK